MNMFYFNQSYAVNNITLAESLPTECIGTNPLDVLIISILIDVACFDYMIEAVMRRFHVDLIDLELWSHVSDILGAANPMTMYKCLAILYGIPYELFVKCCLFLGIVYLYFLGQLITVVVDGVIQFLVDFHGGFFGIERDEWP